MRDDLVHLAGEAVDQARLQGRGRRLSDHGRRLDEIDTTETRRPREERVHRNLDAGCKHASDEIPFGRNDVEVRRRPEIDDDRRRAVTRVCRDGVDDAIRPDVARIVVEDPIPVLIPARRPAASPTSNVPRDSS